MKRGHVYQDQGQWVVSNVQRTEDWGLDLLGNWDEYDVTGDETISEDRSHNDLNQITAIGQTSLSYDLQGNLTDDGTQKYVWDIAGRLKEVRDAQNNLIQSHEYDAYGRRVSVYTPASSLRTHVYYDGWRVIEEYTDDGESTTLSARNVWGLYLDETVVRTSVADSKDYYPCLNPIYSPLRLYDGNASLVARVKYTPYGKPTLIGSGGDPVSPDFPHLFTGQRYDSESGLYYFKNRYHSPSLGRFLSPDIPRVSPYGQSVERYAYTGSGPTNRMDTLGLWWWCEEISRRDIGYNVACRRTITEVNESNFNYVFYAAAERNILLKCTKWQYWSVDYLCYSCLSGYWYETRGETTYEFLGYFRFTGMNVVFTIVFSQHSWENLPWSPSRKA